MPGKRPSRLRTFFTILGLSLVGFLLLLLLTWLAQRLLSGYIFFSSYWAVLAALSAAVTAATILSAAFVAYRELNESAILRQMEVADRLFSELNSDDAIKARRFVYLELDPDPAKGLPGLSDEQRALVKRVLNSLDRVAFLTQPEWVDEDLLMPWMNPMVVKSWEKLGPYVLYERQRRGEPGYYQMAELLAKRCIAWRDQNFGPTPTKLVDKAL